ncbi:hypothetical protein B0T10DRAFT_559525 [Thelonectria olida]|uniref:NACHT domain-containing protein n=1 Tax=Thelonectria olida TaxID=1576542 RepID=A0A9P8WD65_9HYPO|nr:hypothetical protein B0T10DRAFT_559525 [Thelonectria olida]
MQKSQFGLFQSLLFQILRSDDALASELCLGRDNMEPWTFCFFIDGLDEYDGEEEDILSTIERLPECPSIGICASSRPWNTFCKAFQSSKNRLAVDDLTKVDIKNCIKSELEECGEVFARDQKCEYIIEEVSRTAHGVSLWVYLVVRGLKKGLRSEESFKHLSKRVDELPPDINEHFRIIFDRIDLIYREETARLFLIQLYWSRCATLLPLPALAYHGLESEMGGPDYALKQEIKTVSNDVERGTALSATKSEQEIGVTRINDRGRDH